MSANDRSRWFMVTPPTPRAHPRAVLWVSRATGTAFSMGAVLSLVKAWREGASGAVAHDGTPHSSEPRTGRPMPAVCEALSFRPSAGFSLGVEEEVLMASPSSLRAYGGTDAVLAVLDPVAGTITGEVTDGVLELVTPVHGRVGEAIDVLRGLRAEAGRHVRLLGAGVHPVGRFGDVRLRAGARYELIGDSMRALMRQTPHCGVHVHVGMPDGETAARACNGMRAWIPRDCSSTAPCGRRARWPTGRSPWPAPTRPGSAAGTS